MPAGRDVRPAAVAGRWYPGARDALVREVDGYLASVSPSAGEPPRALIAPHAGLMYSGPVAAHAYVLVKGQPYEAVVLVGPSHFVPFEGVSIWPRGTWHSPLGPLAVDENLASTIAAATEDALDERAAHAREHSLEMQLPFVAHLLPGVPIVPLLIGYQTRRTTESLGGALATAIGSRRILLVASSDLSHYQDAATAAAMDRVVLDRVESLDPDGLMHALDLDPGHACGGAAIVAVLRATRLLGATRARVLRYADSGDVSGDKSAVVGYMAAAIW